MIILIFITFTLSDILNQIFPGFILMIAAVASTYFAYAELIPNKLKHIGLWDICDDTQTYSCFDMIEYMTSIDRGTGMQTTQGFAVFIYLFF